jgi:hypothetical protein
MKDVLGRAFQQMGARAQVTVVPQPGSRDRRNRRRWDFGMIEPVKVDIGHDQYGEYFDIRHRPEIKVYIADSKPKDRHLVLVAAPHEVIADAETFLCGRDEHSWFVAAIPESARARSVQEAKDALKPKEVWDAMKDFGVPMDRRDRRRTAAFVRQGEWFFIPRPDLVVPEDSILRDEPMRRGAGKPHMCDFLYRIDGELVYVNDRYPNGLTPQEYEALPILELIEDFAEMVRGAHVFVRGKVRHPDHSTIWLGGWHEVVMNTESQARAMQHVAFLD